MKLTYQTGVAGVVQLVVMTVLNFANGIYSGVQQCTGDSTNCVSNIILSLLYFMLITAWFATLCALGGIAQERRSRKLAVLLLSLEVIVALVALSDAKRHTYLLGLITSLTDAILAIWVSVLAFRLARAGGMRVTSRPRRRRRPTTPTEV